MSAYSQQRQATVPHGGSHLGLCAEAIAVTCKESVRQWSSSVEREDLLLLLMLLVPAERGLFVKKIVVPRQKPDEERGGFRGF